MDKYESNEWDNGEEYQVKDAGNLMTFARNIRAIFRLATIHQVTGGSEEVNLNNNDESWWILAFNIPYQSRCGSRSPDQETDPN